MQMHHKKWLLVLMGLALGLRVWRYLSADLARDTAICGLMGLSVLHGDFLLFFFGQKFMGALDAYLSAPIYLLLRPSVLTANLLPAFLSLATVFGLYLLLRQHFSPVGSLTGLLFTAVPTAISLYWVTQGKPFYHLAMFFSVSADPCNPEAGRRPVQNHGRRIGWPGVYCPASFSGSTSFSGWSLRPVPLPCWWG